MTVARASAGVLPVLAVGAASISGMELDAASPARAVNWAKQERAFARTLQEQ